MNCLVVDDEPLARDILEDYINEWPALTLIGSCKSAVEAMDMLENHTIDILFLDINMPKLSGLDLIRTLKQTPEIILTTAYPEYAIESYELSVTDYLLKPISFERFIKAVKKASAHIDKRQEDNHELLTVKADKKTWLIHFKDIRFIEAVGDYISIKTEDKNLLVHSTLKSIEDQLPPNRFFRVHKSYIAALQYVNFVEGNMISIADKQIPIGKTYRHQVAQWLEHKKNRK